MRIRPAISIALALTSALGAPASAQQRADSAARDTAVASRARPLTQVTVTGRRDDLTGVAVSASQGRIGRADLRQRPLLREGELLEAVPGMILTQHSGDGKANQMFLRGFNLDHGTDFQTRLESMPLNLVTHAHGQGYSDLNLLIPELVDHVSYALGPYYPELGDFGSAGGATINFVRTLDAPIASVEGGAWGYRRALAAGSRSVGTHTLLAGGEVKDYDGPWQVPQGLAKRSGMARYSWTGARQRVSVLGLSYANRWSASDQIPERAVQSGTLSRYGQVDPSLGGETQRHSLSLDWQRQHARGSTTIDAYAVKYDFTLYSNFTYFLDNPAGDQIRQRDARTIYGADVEHTQRFAVGAHPQQWRVGLQARYDDADVSLARTAAREFSGMVRADLVRQGSASAWSGLETHWTDRLRSTVGLRGDAYRFNVRSDRADNSGVRTAVIASPKASLMLRASDGTEVYVGGGIGFHSNDARGTTIHVDPASGDRVDPVDPLVRSRGAETGLRISGPQDLRTTVALWTLRLDSELLFVGDAGTTEPQGRSARSGLTIANYWRPLRSVAVDADVSLTHARYRDEPAGARRVPGALENVLAGGVLWTPGASGLSAVIRVRHFGAHPLIEDNSVRGTPTTLVNASVGVPLPRGLRLSASVLNLLGASGRDVQYYYASRLAGEAAAGVEDIHFHPVEPRQLRLGISTKY